MRPEHGHFLQANYARRGNCTADPDVDRLLLGGNHRSALEAETRLCGLPSGGRSGGMPGQVT